MQLKRFVKIVSVGGVLHVPESLGSESPFAQGAALARSSKNKCAVAAAL